MKCQTYTTKLHFLSVSRNYAAIVRAIGDKHECGGSQLDDSRLENGISLTVRGNDLDFDSGVELITNLFVRFERVYRFIEQFRTVTPTAYSSRTGCLDPSLVPWLWTIDSSAEFHPFYNWPRFVPSPPPPGFRFSPAAYGNRGMLSPIQ